jgi:hypothetical protein
MDFISTLRPEHLQSFWYSASKYSFALVGTFISLLWATAIDKDEADMYKKSLDEYRWVLRLSSKSADFLERAISMLAMSTGVLVKGIPDQPDAERILSRNLRGVRHGSDARIDTSRYNTHLPPVVYQSESEAHSELSPEIAIGDTPSDGGLILRDWNVDHAWFSALSEVGDASEGYGEPGVIEPYSEMDLEGVHVQSNINYRQH